MTNFFIGLVTIICGLAFILIPALSFLGVISGHELFLTFQEYGADLRSFGAEHPLILVLIYLLVFTGALALILPIMTLATILGGFLFGPLWGSVLAMLAVMSGSSIVFFMVQSGIEKKLQQKHLPLYEKLEKFLDHHMWGTMFFLRVIPAFPFSIINLSLSLFSIPYYAYAATLFFGTLPALIIFCMIGERFQHLTSLDNLFSTEIIIALTALGAISLAGEFMKDHFLKKR
ncbi:MAG: hypothetical protein GC136_04840 [Alphaproteobacteria bacterium]|nr:hypothetical protein [Alphaproteobacteria bacterium]